MNDEIISLDWLKGKIITKIDINREHSEEPNEILFTCADGDKYIMYHDQDCCEDVYLEDIEGDINNLLNTPILEAHEVSNNDDPNSEYESVTWTFYKFSSAKGYVTLRWLGNSNGYYSEDVTFKKITN